MKKLNAKEQAVLDYICRITKERGYAPSVRDIQAALGYKSTSTVQMYLDRLAECGYIRKNGRPLIHIQDLKRREKYNIKNYLTALAMTAGFASEERALEIIRDFGGIPHRGERLGKISGIEFINSSIDTTPERTMSTLREMPEGIIILLGGRDKGLDLTRLSAVINKRGDRAIVFGEAEDKFATAFGDRCIKAHGGLGCAIAKAKEIAKTNDTILLSPGATSYDEFRSFENRGDEFKRLVKEVF